MKRTGLICAQCYQRYDSNERDFSLLCDKCLEKQSNKYTCVACKKDTENPDDCQDELCISCGTHYSHCCTQHGCKYGGEKGCRPDYWNGTQPWKYCPVLEGDIKQEGPCMDCDGDSFAEGCISQLTTLEILEQVLLDIDKLTDNDKEPEWYQLMDRLGPLYSLKDWLTRDLMKDISHD